MFDYKQKINRTQSVLTAEQYNKLIANGKTQDQDHAPVVKFFDPCGAGTWLLSEVDEDGVAFGLCDLGMDCAELGSVSLTEMIEIQHMRRAPLGRMGIERDLHFKGEHPMSWYVELANRKGSRAGV